MIEKYLRQYPVLIQLNALLKYILKKRDLNDTRKGGCCSHLLLHLLISYIKFLDAFETNINSLGSILLGFLKYYIEFDYDNYGISLHKGKYRSNIMYRTVKNKFYKESLLRVDDILTDEDIGAPAFKFSDVIYLFKCIKLKLEVAIDKDNVSYLRNIVD